MAQENTARVITIAATEQPQDIRLRVAAYARVSSSSDEQLNSFAAQNRYYTELISSKDNWQLVDIYADEGITGTSIEKRDDFKRMLRDCEHGLIDRILVKSISRFARNTTECLETVRSLKARGVSVYFEKEGIDTGKVSGEMLTAVFASLAQAESESISKNVRWSYEKRMSSGQFVTCKAPLGYRTQGSKLYIVDEEAEVVRYIFDEYLSGKSRAEIASSLNASNAPRMKEVAIWKESTVYHVLTNEKYTGNALVGKNITTNTLPRRKHKNYGEQGKYYITGSHPAIISQETFELAQARLRTAVSAPCQNHIFSRKIKCGRCGAYHKRRRAGDIEYWTCYNHFKDAKLCDSQSIKTETIETGFLHMHYKLKHGGIQILNQMSASLQEIRSRRMLWSVDVIELNKRISDLLCQNQLLATLKQQGLVDPDIFIYKTNAITKDLRDLKVEKDHLICADDDNNIEQIREIIGSIESSPEFLTEFSRDLFTELVEYAIVDDPSHIRFRLKCGLELHEVVEEHI